MLSLVLLPSPSLRQKSKDITLPLTPEQQTFVDEMFIAMQTYDGVGLAAPQVGSNINIIVINTEESPTAYINPVIKKYSWRKEKMEEGCLSVPGVYGSVKRSITITVEYYDRQGNFINEVLTGYLARVFQHEVDHLNGVLFIDRTKEITKGQDELDKMLSKK